MGTVALSVYSGLFAYIGWYVLCTHHSLSVHTVQGLGTLLSTALHLLAFIRSIFHGSYRLPAQYARYITQNDFKGIQNAFSICFSTTAILCTFPVRKKPGQKRTPGICHHLISLLLLQELSEHGNGGIPETRKVGVLIYSY